MNTARCIIALALLIALGIAAHLFLQTAAPSGGADGNVRIGVILPLTGNSATAGDAIRNALELAREGVNQTEKWADTPLVFEYRDGGCSFEGGRQAAADFIEDGIAVIIGGYCSGETLGAGSVTQDAGVLLLTPSSSNSSISDLGDLVFRLTASDASASRALAREVFANGYASPGVIYEETEYASGLANEFIELYADLGGAVALEESFVPDAQEFDAQVRAVLDGPALDSLVILSQSATTMRLLLERLFDAGVNDVQYFGNVFAGSEEVLALGDPIRGARHTVPFFDESNPLAQDFLKRYHDRHPVSRELPPFYLATSYDAVYILADALTPGKVKPRQVAAYLSDLEDYHGASGRSIRFDERGDANHVYGIKEIE